MGIISKIIGFPLGLIIWLIYQVCHSYVISIIIFTLITKILFFPISVKTQKSTAAMQALQPKLEKLKKQYGKNQEKLNEATMQLYADEGINPMGSCLPMLIQFPLLYGVLDVVYRPISHMLRVDSAVIEAAQKIVLNETVYGTNANFNHRPELFILQAIKNPEYASLFADPKFAELVEKVKDFNNTFFGVDLSLIPSLKPEVWDKTAVILVLIPILSGVFQLIMSVYSQIRQKKINPEASSSMGGMNIMFYVMPIISVWIALSFPAAIGFYWTVSSLFSLLQQIILNKIYTPEYVEKLLEKDRKKRKNSKKQGMMQRYQQLLAEQQAAQNGGKPTIKTTASVSDDDEVQEIKLTKSQQKEMGHTLVKEARRRQEEKYNNDLKDLSEYERNLIIEARRRQAEKYGEDFDENEEV